MFRNLGWAAFLASLVVALTTGSGTALANGTRATYACFSPDNASIIGRLGAADQSVRFGFEAGECLAFAPGLPVYEVERFGTLWRFRTMGAAPYLYVADWAAGFQPAPTTPTGFERYIGVSARLLDLGRNFVECYDASVDFAKRYDGFERRWQSYQALSRTNVKTGLVLVIYLGDTQRKLDDEREQLMREAAALDRRCAPYRQIDFDNDFVAFLRTRTRS